MIIYTITALFVQVLESTFAKAAPVYDAVQPKKGKVKGKATPKKEKDNKKKKSLQEAQGALPAATVGPVTPSLKMKQNPAMAMAVYVPRTQPLATPGIERLLIMIV